ncbi:MAG TPA: phosphoenolpyruvate carboxylase [Burkholderiales bacterium]|nr:phosphoenolpyruvate carboxylase [Burkholderiales bacterium]
MPELAFLGLSPHDFELSQPLADDIALLDHLLGVVLAQQNETELLAISHRLYAEPDDLDPRTLFDRMPELGDPRLVQRLLRAYTMLFQLMNSAEQKEIVRVNREREMRAGRAARTESIAEAVQMLHGAGVSASGMQRLIDRLEVSPTLTAHPTEARRRSVLDKLQAIARVLADRSLPRDAPRLDGPLNAGESAEREMGAVLTALWQTDELRASQLTVSDEATNTLYFFERSIFDIVAWLHDDLRAALRQTYPGHTFEIGPFLRYRSWVGGDRDGNPNVTPEITWETLRRHKARILGHYVARTEALRRELTQSTRLVRVSEDLLQSLAVDAQRVRLSETELRRYRLEPYALKLVYVEARLRATLTHVAAPDDFSAAAASAAVRAPGYPKPDDFVHDLQLIQCSLRANRGEVLADEGPLARLVTQAMTFGFHLATLDIRQHSDEHAAAIEEMLAAARLLPAGTTYDGMSEADKVQLLTREIRNPRPLLADMQAVSEHARRVLQVFQVVREARRQLSPLAVDTYVISMTHGVSDILEVLLLAKEAGLLRWRVDGSDLRMESDIDVAPLFETIADLHGCEQLMRELFSHPTYRAHLDARGTFQEIMLGYSDSSKDGGFLAANLTLYDAQSRLAKACREAGVSVRFFHGRGGTVGRGGGRANRAILSQPPGSFDGRIRFTEQGEVISFRYGVPPLGHRHMEQIVSAALVASSDQPPAPEVRAEWLKTMEHMAVRSLQVYRALVHDDPDFWAFYSQATPIKYISRLPIASRPASRSRKLSSVEALRAIPWVFAWVQSRYVVPGWYGLGSALEAFAGNDPEKVELLIAMYRDWLFFRMVVNNAQLELLRADLSTAAWYAARVQPAALGARIHGQLAQEHALAREWILRITEQTDLLGHAPVVRRTVELRNPALRPLSKIQVALLERLEQESAKNGQPDPAWQEAMLLSITGIAAAMQSTG